MLILNVKMKNMTRTNITHFQINPLTMYVDRTFNEMRLIKNLKLGAHKELVVKVFLLSATDVLSKSCTKEGIDKSNIATGVLDTSTKSCPDLYSMINSVNIHWNKVPGGNKWFIYKLKPGFVENFNCGNIGEGCLMILIFLLTKTKVVTHIF